MITIQGKQMLFPNEEQTFVLGDNGTTSRTFRLSRYEADRTDLAGLTFRLDLEYKTGEKNTALLTKEVREESILLLWNVTKADIRTDGTMFLSIRAFDETGEVRWNTARTPIFGENAIDTPGSYEGSLSELEQMEQKISHVLDSESKREAAEAERKTQEGERETAETARQVAEEQRKKDMAAALEAAAKATEQALNAEGPPGPAGEGFQVLGSYETLEELRQGVTEPKPGMAYAVGAVAPYDIYIYDAAKMDWTNHEKLQGPPGKDGAQGPAGPPGKDGAQGPTGPPGKDGAQGPAGPPGKDGAQGLQGPTGEGFQVLGSYETLEELRQGVTEPKPGMAYAVGAVAPYDIYIYDAAKMDWTNHEKLQGPPGKDGAQGPAGPPGKDGAQGPTGPPGKDGATGQDGRPGTNGKGAYETAKDAGYKGTEQEFSETLAQVPVHQTNNKIHVTEEEKNKWNKKADLGEDGKILETQLPAMGGIPAEIIATTEKGATVTCTKGEKKYQAMSNGTIHFQVYEYGEWTIRAEKEGRIAEELVVIDTVKQYVVDALYYKSLETCTWEKIDEVSKAGEAAIAWKVGDEKNIVVNGETLTLVILGFQQDDLTGGGKAGITFGLKHLMKEKRRMNSTATNKGGFTGSEMYNWLQNTLLKQLPIELQAVLKSVDKKTSIGNQGAEIRTNEMKIFLFSEVEVFGMTENSFVGEGSQYPYFATVGNRIKKLANGADKSAYWWERSPWSRDNTYFCNVNNTGGASAYDANISSRGVCFGFCV